MDEQDKQSIEDNDIESDDLPMDALDDDIGDDVYLENAPDAEDEPALMDDEADDDLVDAGENDEYDNSGDMDDEEYEDEDDYDAFSEIPIMSPANSPDVMDIDAALAAVSQLNLLTQDEVEDGDIDDAGYRDLAQGDQIQPFQRDSEPAQYVEFVQPREMSMSRGQLASVIPALVLIVLGGWLTFTLTTSGQAPSAGLLMPILMIAGGVVFLSQWLTSERWARGSFFFGSVLILIGAVQLYLGQVNPMDASNGWALWIVAIGLALFVTGLLTQPKLPRLSIMGVLVIVAGAIGYAITSGLIPAEVTGLVSNFWMLGAVIAVILLLAPLLRRRQ